MWRVNSPLWRNFFWATYGIKNSGFFFFVAVIINSLYLTLVSCPACTGARILLLHICLCLILQVCSGTGASASKVHRWKVPPITTVSNSVDVRWDPHFLLLTPPQAILMFLANLGTTLCEPLSVIFVQPPHTLPITVDAYILSWMLCHPSPSLEFSFIKMLCCSQLWVYRISPGNLFTKKIEPIHLYFLSSTLDVKADGGLTALYEIMNLRVTHTFLLAMAVLSFLWLFFLLRCCSMLVSFLNQNPCKRWSVSSCLPQHNVEKQKDRCPCHPAVWYWGIYFLSWNLSFLFFFQWQIFATKVSS